MGAGVMLIEKKNTADLLPADYNPRKDLKPGDAEYEKLKRSIEQFGYVEPVIWNKTTGRVVGGHQRLKVLIDMGITEVECVVVEMDEEKEKALNIALNKISGDWDKDKLALLIADLQGTDFDVSLTGFEPAEIDDLFKDTLKDGVKEDAFDVGAELEKPTFSKAGDIWTLGRHRLICGDSTKAETFDLLMGSTKNIVQYSMIYMCAAFRERDLVVDFFCRNKQTFLLAQLAQRMLLHIAVTDTLPSTTITTAHGRVTVIFLVALVLLAFMFFTKPTVSKPWAAGIGTWSLGVHWHRFTSFRA